MGQIIIAISGRKNAGKDSIAKFVANYYAYRQIYPGTSFIYDASKDFLKSELFYSYIRGSVGFYSFADTLKAFCIETLGLDHNQCYGSDEQKNSPTKYRWEDVQDIYLRWKFSDAGFTLGDTKIKTEDKNKDREYFWRCIFVSGITPNLKSGYMSGREIMQLFGTELIRNTFGNVWSDSTLRKIQREGKPLALISDNRFKTEIASVLEHKGHIIRLTRTPFGHVDSHASEAELDDFDWNVQGCHVLDNQKMNEDEQNKVLIPILNEIGI